MRPIERGAVPTNADGTSKTVSNYRNWRKDLITRVGNYCSFCEMTLNDSPQVEHVIAQYINSGLNIWNGQTCYWLVVLAIVQKSHKACSPQTHYLPTVHNTFLPFQFSKTTNTRQHNEPASFVIINHGLTANQQVKAQNTLDLCQLHTDYTAFGSEQKVTDLRWKYRMEAIHNAELWRQEWDNWGHQSNVAQFVGLLITAAKAKGFWSVWFTIFQDVQDIRQALITEFAGTAINCFDKATYLPIHRNQMDSNDSI